MIACVVNLGVFASCVCVHDSVNSDLWLSALDVELLSVGYEFFRCLIVSSLFVWLNQQVLRYGVVRVLQVESCKRFKVLKISINLCCVGLLN